MSYSCTDFVDTILESLAVDVPRKYYDSPSAQADMCVARIDRLRADRAQLLRACTAALAALESANADPLAAASLVRSALDSARKPMPDPASCVQDDDEADEADEADDD